MSDVTKVTYTSYVDVRYDKLVIVSRRITEGYYNRPEIVDLVIGKLIDIIA